MAQLNHEAVMQGLVVNLFIQLLLERHGGDKQGGILAKRWEVRAVQSFEQEALKCEIGHDAEFAWEVAIFF